MCPSANIIRLKDKLILRVNDLCIYFQVNRQQNLILWTVRRSVVEKSGLELVRLYIKIK